MAKILGLDLGTNSIGWAVVEKEDNQFSLLDKGVRIFQEGVKIEKGIESSKAAERTEHRSSRKIKFRRKLRKIETLKVLSEFGYCPELSKEELDLWRYKKIYPNNPALRNWWLTDDKENKHPYYYRHLATTQKFNLNIESDRFKLGRSFYHMAQRRGFLSNRLESTKESNGLEEEKGELTLGEYFYQKYEKGEKIRDNYTHREKDYLDEFNRICDFQNIPNKIKDKLLKAIFYQRPLKSQKGLIGKCVFEPNKQRCSVSRPEFEEYRMLCFINNIKIKTPDDEKLRFLNNDERKKVISRFFLQREHFDFEDLAKQLAPKKQYKFYKDRNKNPEDWLFNFSMKTTVSGCPVSARFKELFEDIFMDKQFNYIKDETGNTPKIIVDTWHALYTFDSDDRLKEFAHKHLNLNNEQIDSFLKIRLKQDFASLSLKAINKILPYLREGLIYSHAVFIGNMEEAVPNNIWNDKENQLLIKNAIKDIINNHNDETTIINIVNGFITNAKRENTTWSEESKAILLEELNNKIIQTFGKYRFESFSEAKKTHLTERANQLLIENMPKNYGKGEHIKAQRIDEAVQTFLTDNFGKVNTEKIYHPSAIETYKPAKRADDGNLYLGSPMTSSVRNPMAMRALHQLRKVINELIKEGIIDTDTKINIEMSRGLLNANERTALRRWQDDREKQRKEYANKIKEHFGNNYQPSEDEILKYQLWIEQKGVCLYSSEENCQINIEDFLGNNPSCDIEHTIPRSLSYDNSQENKTLCKNEANRKIKRNKIPYELSNHQEILLRIEHWREKIESLDKQIEITVKRAKGASDKARKDSEIQKRHYLTFERNYWRNKYNRFTMKDVPDGFKNSQMVDIGIITKYSRLYLKTIFNKVYTVKGSTVADFRKMWGIQNSYEKKARVNHIHHCIDAITMACMDKSNYETLAKFYHDSENAFQNNSSSKPYVEKPWQSFTEDILSLENEILVSHYTPDNLPKQSKKKLRKRGKIQYNESGEPKYQQGDSVRGSLHKKTFYGAIEREVINKKGESEKVIKYVVRKSLASLEDNNIKNIVDDRVRNIVIEARKQEKEIQKQIDALTKKRKKAEEWEEVEIDETIANLKIQIEQLYTLPNKNGNSIPIKKVRVYQPTVTNPLNIKTQRDKSTKSKKEYKEHYHVANDGNYLMAIYEGKDENGKTVRDFELVNNLNAGEYFKLSVQKDLEGQDLGKYEGLIPKSKLTKKIQIPLKAVINVGTMVILWENTPDEVWDLSIEEIKKRLFKVNGLSILTIQKKYNYGRIYLKIHNDSHPSTELKEHSGEYKSTDDIFPFRMILHNQLNALIEGIDFTITPLGKLIKIEH